MRAVICQVVAKLGDWELQGEAGMVHDVGERTLELVVGRMLSVALSSLKNRDPMSLSDVGLYLETCELDSDTDEARIVANTIVYPNTTPGFVWKLSKPKKGR